MAQSRQIPLFDLGPDPVHSADAQGFRQARCRAPVGHARFKNDWRTPSARITAQDAAILRLHGFAAPTTPRAPPP